MVAQIRLNMILQIHLHDGGTNTCQCLPPRALWAAYTKEQLLPPAQEQGAAPEHCFCFENFVPPQFVSHSRITGHLPNKTNPKLICIWLFAIFISKGTKKQLEFIILQEGKIYIFFSTNRTMGRSRGVGP